MDLARQLDRFLAHGDEAAIERFVQVTRPRLDAVARRIVGPDFEDVVQTAYLSLLRRRETPRPSPMAWLLTAVVRISYRHVARRRRDLELTSRLSVDVQMQALTAERALQARQAVDRLPPKYRDVVVLHYLCGLTTPECARLLDVSEPAARQRLKRARDLLRTRLAPGFALALWWLPWRCADAATTLFVGGIVKSKVKLILALVLVIGALVATAVHLGEGQPDPDAERTMMRNAEIDEAPKPSLATRSESPQPRHPRPSRGPAGFARGVVVDSRGAPLADVDVVVQRQRGGEYTPEQPVWIAPSKVSAMAVATTDEEGRFRIESVEVGLLHGLAFFKPDYTAVVASVSADPALNQSIRVILKPSDAVVGFVRDTAGRPVRLARVGVSPSSSDGVGQIEYTDARGRFEFRSLTSSATRGFVSASGYVRQMIRPREHDEIVLVRNSIVVDVVDKTNQRPIAHANAMVAREPADTFVAPAHRVEAIGDVPAVPGRLILQTSDQLGLGTRPDMHASVQVFADGYVHESFAVSVTRTDEPPHIIAALAPGAMDATITGTVRGSADCVVELRAGAVEGASEGHDRYLLMSVPTTEGRFQFSAPPGPYRLVARSEGLAPAQLEIEAPARDVEITFLKGCGLEVKTNPGGWIHVEVIGADEQWWNQPAGTDGVARFVDLPEGVARIAASRFDQWLSAGPMWSIITPQAKVALTAGEVAQAHLVTPTKVGFSIVVRDTDGRPRSGVTVNVSVHGGHARFAGGEMFRLARQLHKTDDAGHVSLPLYPGTYVARMQAGGRTSSDVVTVPDAGGQATVVFPSIGSTLLGRVVDWETGMPVVGHRVTVRRQGNQTIVGTARTDSRGSYEVGGLPEEVCTIEVRGPGGGLGGLGGTPPGPYGCVLRTVRMPARGEMQADFKVPKIRGDAAVHKPIRIRIRAVEAQATKKQLNAAAIVYVQVKGTWIETGWTRCAKDGSAEMSTLEGDQYRVELNSGVYRPAIVEVPGGGELVEVDVVLKDPL